MAYAIDGKPFSDAALPIWGLVSGIPAPRRNSRLLLMLQAFLDESISRNPSLYVMAGFISSTEKWALFSDEWQSLLDMSPRIKYFKMSEAMRLQGEFRDWREDARNEKLRLLMACISNHALVAVSGMVQPDVYKKIFDDLGGPKQFRSPHYQLTYGIIGEVAARQKEYGLNEKIDFIFDEQVIEKGAILDDWDTFKKSTRAPKELIGNSPSFRDDMDVLPLQAADLNAYILREDCKRAMTGNTPLKLPSKVASALNPAVISLVWTEDVLQAWRREIQNMKPVISGNFGEWDFKGYY